MGSGVPQGSVLGPLLFLIYVNDIGDNLRSHLKLFANDCTVYREIITTSDCEALQDDLNAILHWTRVWQLSLNVSKCTVMTLSNKRSLPIYTYHLNNTPLQWCDSVKYLGVRLDKKLTWGPRVAEVRLKATTVLNLLRRTLHRCNTKAKTRTYQALVRPRLEYCAPVWKLHKSCDIAALEKVKARAARWICGSSWDKRNHQWSKSSRLCLTELKWMSVES